MREWIAKYKKNIIIVLSLLVVLGGIWQVMSGKVAKAFQEGLVASASQKINGRLQVGAIDLSLLNWVRLRDVAVYDRQGDLIAKSPTISIKYQLANLLKGNLDMSSIEVVAVQEAELWLKLAKGNWNWQNLMTTDDKQSPGFRGVVEFGEGTVHIGNEQITQTIDDMNGSLKFATYPDSLAVDLKGRINQATLAITGNWGEKPPAELTLRTDNFDVSSLSGLLPATQEIRLEKGIAQNVQVTVRRDEKDLLHYQAEGGFAELAISGKVAISDGQGKFKADQTGVHFTDLALSVAGQRATGSGSFLFQGNQQSLNFAFTLPDVDTAALFSGLTVQRPLAASLDISGPPARPVVAGSFTAPQITVSDLTVSAVSGNIRYEDGRLLLQQATGSVYQGQLAVAGEILTASESYELEASGSGMNSSALTDKDVQGPLDFDGRISGKGAAAVAQGDFIIRNGKAYGVSFQTLTGSFIKRGGATEISDIAITTALGTFYPEQISQEALERLNQRNIPTSREEVKKAATDALIKKIFR